MARVIRDCRKTRPVHVRTGYQARPASERAMNLLRISPSIALLATGQMAPSPPDTRKVSKSIGKALGDNRNYEPAT
jgi:hypothetical protein